MYVPLAPWLGAFLLLIMSEILFSINDIPDSGECPVCVTNHNNWMPYIDPDNKELGTICPTCDTHFIDVDASRAEFEYY